jgi:protein TonB
MHSIGAGVFPVLSAQEVIRVGGSVKAPKKMKDVKPICPSTAPAGETMVRLTGRVSVDGFVVDLTPVPADAGPEPPIDLVEAALAAVRQWAFTPTLLNGQPVEVNITVDILFRKS